VHHPPYSSARRHQPGQLGQLPIETTSLTLRAFVPEDAAKIFQMSQEEGMRTWLPSQVYRDEAHAASVLASLMSQYTIPGDPARGPYVLGVELRSTRELIGHVGFSPFEEAVEVGYAIEAAHQRKGFATEAVRAACEWAASAFSIPTILGVTAAQNSASHGVLLRAGFTRQKETVMRFQGLEQPVIFFAFTGAQEPPRQKRTHDFRE
jgi:[ribosomal protein S5]-alanine N-acetyltransferase